MKEIEKSLDNIESTLEGIAKRGLEIKAHERPVVDMPKTYEIKSLDSRFTDNKIQDFVKGNAKSLSDGQGQATLSLRAGELSKVFSALETPRNFRNCANTLSINTEHFEGLLDKNDADAGWGHDFDNDSALDMQKITIPTHEMFAKARISQKMLDDTQTNLEVWLKKSMTEKFSNLEENAFLNGTGDNQPKGLLSYPRGSSASYGTVHEFLTGAEGGFIDADVLMDTVASLKTAYLHEAVWVMSRDAYAEIRKLKDNATGRFVMQPTLTEGTPSTLLGYPVVLSDALGTLHSGNPCIVFGNFKKAYQIVDRSDVHVLRDPYSAKPFVEFFMTKRVGGDVVDFDAFRVISAKTSEEDAS